jgi:hypothetical protein
MMINQPQPLNYKISKIKRQIGATGQHLEEENLSVEAPNRKDCEEMFERWNKDGEEKE